MSVTTAARPGTARRARTDRTRAAIVAAAHDAFVERGYRATSLRDIASAAGISHPGLLRHFATKGELLAAVVAALERDNAEYLLGRGGGRRSRVLWSSARWRVATRPCRDTLHSSRRSPARHRRRCTPRTRSCATGTPSSSRSRPTSCSEAIEDGLVAADRDARDEADAARGALGRTAAAHPVPAGARRRRRPRSMHTRSCSASRADGATPKTVARVGRRHRSSPCRISGNRIRSPRSGYRVGRERRARIVADAMALFARDGYGDTSLQSIARPSACRSRRCCTTIRRRKRC